MKSMLLLSLFGLFTTLAFADNPPWLQTYLRSKSILCSFPQGEYEKQIDALIDQSVQQLGQVLQQRGSEYQSIERHREQREIGTFPHLPGFDFFVLERISVVFSGLNLQIQTTLVDEHLQTSARKGLWLPLTVKDPGRDKPCELARISVSEDQRPYLPVVELVYGDPPKAVPGHLIEVVDISNQPSVAPQPTKAPEEPPRDEKQEEKKEVKTEHESKRESRRQSRRERLREERREERRERRERERERRRSRRHERRRQHTTEQAPPPAQAEKGDCSGDLSPWKSVMCSITGKKE